MVFGWQRLVFGLIFGDGLGQGGDLVGVVDVEMDFAFDFFDHFADGL